MNKKWQSWDCKKSHFAKKWPRWSISSHRIDYDKVGVLRDLYHIPNHALFQVAVITFNLLETDHPLSCTGQKWVRPICNTLYLDLNLIIVTLNLEWTGNTNDKITKAGYAKSHVKQHWKKNAVTLVFMNYLSLQHEKWGTCICIIKTRYPPLQTYYKIPYGVYFVLLWFSY